MKKLIITSLTVAASLSLTQAQTSDSTLVEQKGFRWEGFVDVFYAYDFNEPADQIRQPFLFNHNRHNEFNLNLGMISGSYTSEKVRANLALQVGTYAQDNYSAEEDLLKNVFQANVGVSLNQKNNLWLDAGIFPSHIGFESALSIDNPTLTRSLLAENSPYFLSGARLTYDPTESLTLAALVTNGWQIIQRPDGNQMPGFGTQVNYHPTDAFSLNWSTFIGTDPTVGNNSPMRYFNNLYVQLQPSEGFQFIAGFDIGAQERMAESDKYDIWYTPIVIARTRLSDKLYLAGRAEYYADEEGVIISIPDIDREDLLDPVQAEAFKTWGFSLNLDYEVTERAMFRIEGRHFNSANRVFRSGPGFETSNTVVASSLAIEF
jgi:hypothetical protein